MIPLSFGCPMTTTMNGRRYLATVFKGSDTILRGDRSDVKLEINKGCPKRAYLMEVRTDLSNFGSVIPDDECFISPIVEILAPAETRSSAYVLRIPHCLDEDDDRTKVKVRMIHENRNPAEVLVPERAESTDGALFYDIDARFIELHTTHFCRVICTICQTPYHCRNKISSFWFAKFETQPIKATLAQKLTGSLKGLIQKTVDPIQNDVEIRPYFGAFIHTIVDFHRGNLLCNQVYPNYFELLEFWNYLCFALRFLEIENYLCYLLTGH